MPIATQIDTVETFVKSLSAFPKVMEKEVKESEKEDKQEMKEWDALIDSFDEGLSGRMKKLISQKPDKRADTIKDLLKSIKTYKLKAVGLNDSSLAGYVKPLKSLLDEIETDASALKEDPADEAQVKKVVAHGGKWSNLKKKLSDVLTKNHAVNRKSEKERLARAVKDVKALTTNLSPATLKVFAKLDDVPEGDARKQLATKLKAVFDKLNNQFEIFSMTETGRFESDRCEMIRSALDMIERGLKSAAA